MTNDDKIRLLEEMLEVEEGSLRKETLLTDLDEWDSMAAISLIVLAKDSFSKTITGQEIKNLKSIDDVLNLLN